MKWIPAIERLPENDIDELLFLKERVGNAIIYHVGCFFDNHFSLDTDEIFEKEQYDKIEWLDEEDNELDCFLLYVRDMLKEILEDKTNLSLEDFSKTTIIEINKLNLSCSNPPSVK